MSEAVVADLLGVVRLLPLVQPLADPGQAAVHAGNYFIHQLGQSVTVKVRSKTYQDRLAYQHCT